MDEQESREPFRPVGEHARWRYAYDLVVSKEPGDEVSLHELAEAMDLEFDPLDRDQRSVLHNAMWTAKAHLEEDGCHTVRTVDRFGWVVLTQAQNLIEARARGGKAARAVGRVARLVVATDRDQLSPRDRQEYDVLAAQTLRAGVLAKRRPTSLMELEKLSKRHKEIEGR